MNAFVLCTGRCGSKTFFNACKHIKNFSCGHETLRRHIGSDRMAFPNNHIEIDNRLSWFLGKLESAYGNDAVYVHLIRNTEDVATSFAKRWNQGIIAAYTAGILQGDPSGFKTESDRIAICRDYCETVNSNIVHFLKGKNRQMTFQLESSKTDFSDFWSMIGANGDFYRALAEFRKRYNSTD